MRQIPGELTRYVPHCVVQRVATRVPHESTTALQGAVLFADISGFVPRVERIARQGPGALERLQELLNAVFGHLIERTSRSGGDVLKFAGDALLAAWTAPEGALESAVQAAARCALAIQQQPFRASATLPELRDIRLRIGIATGPLSYSIVGREDLGLSLLPTGAPFQAMGQAAHAASPGEVVLDESAWAMLGPQAVGEPLPGGFVRLRALPSAPALSARDALPPEPPGLAPSALRAFVPRTVLSRLDAGHAEWMAEVRPVSALFINLKEPRLMLRGERAEFQRVTLAVQEALTTFEGHLNQVITEDKGIVFACTFGLPPLCHENDAERAVRGALAISEALRGMGLRHGIGVATGRAFCGTYGADSRCEYAVLGDVVNLSARLMQRAEDEVLCDEPTARAARGRVELEELPPVQLKGKSTPIALSRVLRNKVAGATPAFDTSTWLGQQPLLAAYRVQLERGMVGRKREREQVRGLLDELAAGIGGALLLEADTGLGKSMLLSALLADAAGRQLPCLVGLGDAIERSVAYRAWRPLLEAVLTTRARASAEGATSEEPLREGLREALVDHPHGREWEPLLADVLGLRLPENEVTRAMATEVRGENTHALLVHLLEQTLVRRPFVVAFDDAQWLDPESWRLLVEVRRRVPTVLVVLAGRGMEEVIEERHQLLAAGRATRLELRPLEPDEAHSLVCRRLGVVEALPESLATLLYEKAEGHPLFLEELAYSLYGLGVLRVEDGECQLTVEAGRLREVHLPDTLQGAALSRMDQCSPQQQLVLKVASVVGRSFPYRTVHDVLPVERDLRTLDDNLTSLVQRNLTRLERQEPERVYAFQHGLLHQAAYELLAASQRRALHRAVAQWYERVHGEEPEVYPKLAHHWLEASEVRQALHYLDLASTSAWGRGASREAVYLIEQALALEEKAGLMDTEPLRRARWFRTLGEAAFEGGASERAVERYRQALDALGLPLPRSRFGWVMRLCRELLHGAVTSCWPRALRRALTPELRERLSEAGRSATELARERYNAIDILAMFTASLMAVNKAERSGAFALASDSYNNLGFITGTIGLKRLTQRLFTRAREGNGRALCNQHFARALISLGTGALADSSHEVTTGLEHAKTLGDRYCIVTGLSISGSVLELDGRFAEALEQREEMLDVAHAHGNSRHECWASTGMAAALSVLDRHEEAQAWLHYSRARLPGDDLLTGIGCHAQWAVIRLRAGDATGAREDGERALALWEHSRLNMLPHLGALTDASTVYLTLWEEALATGSPEAETLGLAVRNLSRRLDSYARQFRVGRSRAARIRGSLLWLSRKHGAARKAWTQALDQARRLSMAADEAHALLELARHEPEGTEGRQQKLEQALALFTQLGMVYDVRVCRVLLGTPLVATPALVAGAATAA